MNCMRHGQGDELTVHGEIYGIVLLGGGGGGLSQADPRGVLIVLIDITAGANLFCFVG